MDKDMKELLKDFEESCYRHAFAGSLHPVDAKLVEIGYAEVKYQLYTAIEELDNRLSNALVDVEHYRNKVKR